MSLITEYKDWVDEPTLRNLWGSTVCQPHWFFGQKSNNDTVYPMWGQVFYNGFKGEYNQNANEWIVDVGNRFMDICGDEYIMCRRGRGS